MDSRVIRANLLALLLTVLGCTQMLGYLTGSRALRGVGAASVVAPFPKVFSDVDGLEPFASEFELAGVDGLGRSFSIRLTPERYAELSGSYNRRNVYGAALSYAPRLPDRLWRSVFCYGLGKNGPLRRELGLPVDARDLVVNIRTRTAGRGDVWQLSPRCDP